MDWFAQIPLHTVHTNKESFVTPIEGRVKTLKKHCGVDVLLMSTKLTTRINIGFHTYAKTNQQQTWEECISYHPLW